MFVGNVGTRIDSALGLALFLGLTTACAGTDPDGTLESGTEGDDNGDQEASSGSAPDDSSESGDSDDHNDDEGDDSSDADTGDPEPSGGCGVAWEPDDVEVEEEGWRPASQVVRRTIEVAGVEREYLVAVPKEYDPELPHALIFGFHGRGGDREQLRNYMNMEGPSGDDAIVIYPQGLPVDGGDNGWDLGADSDDLLFFDALADKYGQELCVDEKRIFATGHSFGGCMSNAVGCFRGETLRAIAPIAGCGPFSWGGDDCVGQVASYQIHSPKDTATSYSSAIGGCTTWLRANGCDESPACGCHWVDALDEASDECVQDAQEPYDPGVEIEEDPERDEQSPIFRRYQNCDENYPVVFADHWRRERSDADLDRERWHNPPPWSASTIWEFFVSLPRLE